MKTKFDLEQLITDKRVTVEELAEKTQVHYTSIYVMLRRKTIKVSYLKKLESVYGRCSKYIIKEQIATV